MRALDIVGREGPIAPTDLARRLGFTTGGVTTVIDRLERVGYVLRRPSTTDRRRLVIEVSAITQKMDTAVFGGLIKRTGVVANAGDDKDLQLIQDFLDGVCRVTANYADWLTNAEVVGLDDDAHENS